MGTDFNNETSQCVLLKRDSRYVFDNKKKTNGKLCFELLLLIYYFSITDN